MFNLISSVGLIKPGLGEELTYQRTTFGDIVHQPSSNFNQQFVVTKTHISDSSSETSEGDSRPAKRFTKVIIKSQDLRICFSTINLTFSDLLLLNACPTKPIGQILQQLPHLPLVLLRLR